MSPNFVSSHLAYLAISFSYLSSSTKATIRAMEDSPSTNFHGKQPTWHLELRREFRLSVTNLNKLFIT